MDVPQGEYRAPRLEGLGREAELAAARRAEKPIGSGVVFVALVWRAPCVMRAICI